MSPRRRKKQQDAGKAPATEAELTLLEALWDGGEQTVREISKTASGREPATAAEYATVQSLLDRLERKGLVRRDRSRVPHTFRSAVDRDAYIGRQLEAIANRTTGGALLPLLMNLVKRTTLSDEERRRLLEMIEPGGGGGGAERDTGGEA